MILYCAADLIWATRIKATADALGIPCRPVRTLDMLSARLADSPVRALIIDLETGEIGLSLIRVLRGSAEEPGRDPERNITIVAFGPHVATDLLTLAKSAGADQVMVRGAFDRQLADLLPKLAHKSR